MHKSTEHGELDGQIGFRSTTAINKILKRSLTGLLRDLPKTNRGTWTASQTQLNINALELLTIQLALISTLVKEGQCVAVFTDNIAGGFNVGRVPYR